MLIEVRVNDELVLLAGECERVSGTDGVEWLIRPPRVTLFHQLVEYLREKPKVGLGGSSKIALEGVATAALTVRWGTYLALLLDREKPAWSEVKSHEASRISDEEMARINIEASAALAEWIDIFRADPSGGLYAELVEKAIKYLPMPQRRAHRHAGAFSDLGDTGMAAELVGAMTARAAARVDQVRAAAELHPSRSFANALVNVAWRNGPVEDIHAGSYRGYPIDQRRMTPVEERTLMRLTSDRVAGGMWTCLGLCTEQPPRRWAEQVLPYGLAELMAITPSGWTLTETSREVRLPI